MMLAAGLGEIFGMYYHSLNTKGEIIV